MKKNEFLQRAILQLIEHEVSINIIATDVPKKGNAAGWFGTTPKVFHVYMKSAYGFDVFVHEYNHFLQSIEDPFLWERCRHSLSKFYKYCEGGTIKQVDLHCNATIDLEHDCECRSIQMIRDLKLPIKIKEYIRQANACLYSLTAARHFGRWPLTMPPYDMVSELPTKLLPSHHFKDINNLPHKLFQFFEKQCKEGVL